MELLGSFLTLLTDRIDKMERSWSEEKVILNNYILNYNYCPECKCVNCLKKGTKKENIFINKNTPVRIPPLPKNSPELRFKIKDGKTSFMSLLPFAKLNELDDGHVYCLPSECIKHFLATGNIPMEFNITQPNYPIVNVNQTPRGIKIAKSLAQITEGKVKHRHHFNISFLEWKDDCEPTKSNNPTKFSLWLFTITIFVKDQNIDSSIGTFPVAIGPKNKSHDNVEKIIGDDINNMRSMAFPAIFGWSILGNPFPCTFSADLYLSLGDQPERRVANVMQQGNSRHHARWRHACDYNQLLDVLPSCPKCFEEMVNCDSFTARNDITYNKMIWKNNGCGVCTNWMDDLSSPLLTFERSPKYSKKYILGGEMGEGRLKPIVLTYTILEILEKNSNQIIQIIKKTEIAESQRINKQSLLNPQIIRNKFKISLDI